ncbi:MAG: class I SAM-dependent methyltransferase [Candidatus Acidiferrales bacterium]
MAESEVDSRERFQSMYEGNAPWDIGRPQPAFQTAAGRLDGSILDCGCGTGENALMFAEQGHKVTGIDFLEKPIATAKKKAEVRKLATTFRVADALKLEESTEQFDNAADSGLFHVFSDEDRARYVRGLTKVVRPGGRLMLMCFSDKTPGTEGPRRVTEAELRSAFAKGWRIETLEPSYFGTNPDSRQGMFGGEDPRTWFLIAQRVA